MSGLAKLPWETREDGWQPWPGSIQILSDDGEIIAYTTSGANEKINAAFIIKAVNSHELLMSALEEAAERLEARGHKYGARDAREALAKAATS